MRKWAAPLCGENTFDVYQHYTSEVKPVNIYSTFAQHKEEYLYFNTDTPIGLRKAPTMPTRFFCETAGRACRRTGRVPEDHGKEAGFTGYLYSVSEENCLAEHPDHIDLYDPMFSYTAALSQDGVSFYGSGDHQLP